MVIVIIRNIVFITNLHQMLCVVDLNKCDVKSVHSTLRHADTSCLQWRRQTGHYNSTKMPCNTLNYRLWYLCIIPSSWSSSGSTKFGKGFNKSSSCCDMEAAMSVPRCTSNDIIGARPWSRLVTCTQNRLVFVWYAKYTVDCLFSDRVSLTEYLNH